MGAHHLRAALIVACAGWMTTCRCGAASSTCVPATCASLGFNCGPAGDGCGNSLNCGSCVFPETCGGGGTPSVCGVFIPDGGFSCKPITCADQGIKCGPAGDGCGGSLQCGTCTAPQTCGGGGKPSVCGGDSGCVPKTCKGLGLNCGPAGDGCGGALQCGTCTAPQICGGGGTPSVCGGSAPDGGNPCTPLTCMQVGATCGPAGDGCGGLLDCGSCTAPQTCGGGGTPAACGGNSGCVPTTCSALGFDCGPAGDGCGGSLSCGTCQFPSSCGGGGTPGVCGYTVPDGGNPCTPRTCQQQGFTCGPAGDGCGGALNCGTCTAPQTCGGGGTPGVCGGTSGCVPATCAQLGFNCGPAGDGCGGTLACGTCASPLSCGGGGTPGQCGQPACVPKTCAELGYNCGPAGDGCGGLIASCGSCQSPEVCGAPTPGVCGTGNLISDGGVFVTCADGGVTSISGTVVAGTDPTLGFGQPDPVYNAYVYVPAGAVQPITTGATCNQCSTPQNAIVSVISGVDGTFTLVNPPVGPAITVVIELGKWQRILNVNVQACQNNALPQTVTRLPRTHLEAGNIPLFAIDTGGVDTLECVLRKMGIADSEFVDPALVNGVPTAAGRVHVYQAHPGGGGASGGAIIDRNTPRESQLWGSQTTMDSYDLVLFPCEGGEDGEATASQTNLIDYANAGGRVFATHFSYVWLYNDAPFSGTATWKVNQGSYQGPLTGYVDQSFPKGQALAQWLQLVGASTTQGQIPVNVVRDDFGATVAPSQRWMYTQAPDPAMPIHYTFDTPVGAQANQQCGRVVFSDFHVEDASNDPSTDVIFPKECTPNAPMTPQEKLLEFMLFDLSSCIQPDVPTCTPSTCAQLGFNCGPAGDGCGGQLNCGTCTTGCETCGGGGQSSVCGGQCCQPLTCAQQGLSCGPAGDGCGGTLNCGTCTPPQTCGGGGTPGVCGAPNCTPQTCEGEGIFCGPAGDGCGGQLQCGTCQPPLTCGGGGQPGRCGLADAGACVPLTCASQGFNCGPAGDGCGGALNCGTCTPPQSCGGAGKPGVCGAPACTPETCASQKIGCGPAGDGCGGQLNCGTCTPPESCGGGGTPGQCGVTASCTPQTCASQGFNCGPAGDGCGGQLNCGTCTPPLTCGGGGKPGVCGQPACTPLTCAHLGFNCGPAGDGCGGQLNCGSCTAPQTCGGGGQPGVCGPTLK
jgi:hypothetical protein